MQMDERLKLFTELMHSCHDVGYWCFDGSFGLLSAPSAELAEALDGFAFMSPERQGRILAHARQGGGPLISTAAPGVKWAADFERSRGKLLRLHILGPVYDIGKTLRDEAVPGKRALKAALAQAPQMPADQFLIYIKMLHTCLTGKRLSAEGLSFDFDGDSRPEADHITAERYREVYSAEQELMSKIENGDLNYAKALDAATRHAGLWEFGAGMMTSSMAAAVNFICLSVRAGIRGGLSPSTAYALGSHYQTAAAKCNSVAELSGVLTQMYEDFIRRVRDSRQSPEISRPIRECCDYVDLHLTEELTLSSLAALVGYTEYYLTRKFKREMGISLWEYVNRKKVEMAKILLLDNALTIQDVGSSLNFCSRSYLSEVFQKYAGCSPSAYRRGEGGDRE